MNHQKLLDVLNKAIEIVKSDMDQQNKISKQFKAEDNKLFLNIDKSLFPPETQKILDLLLSSAWPEAVPQFLICGDNDEDKFERAQGILDYIDQDLENKKILDFGCGEGHLVAKAAEACSIAVGYDLKSTDNHLWNGEYNLTTDFNEVMSYGDYDVIVLYDVLDHSEDPVKILKLIKSVCNIKTKIFVRCHSFMSRHGGHLYKTLNKAYLHLFFTNQELSLMGLKADIVQKYYFPIDTHKKWFKESGLTVKSEDIIGSIVDNFFKRDELKSRIPVEFSEFPEWQMSQSFNDYILSL